MIVRANLVFSAVALLASTATAQEPVLKSDIPTAIVQTDLSCLFAVDGRAARKVEPAKPISMRLSKGEHTVLAVTEDGQDSWRGTLSVVRSPAKFLIPIMEVRSERVQREAEIAKLRDQADHARRKVMQAREQQALNPSDPATIVHMITILEQKYANEQASAATYKELADKLEASYKASTTTVGAMGDLVNVSARLNATQKNKLHSERADQILRCIAELTTNLGGGLAFPLLAGPCSLQESQTFGATHTTAWSNGFHNGELTVSPNRIQWTDQSKAKDNFSTSCQNIKRIGTVRGVLSISDELVDGDQFYVATKKKLYAFRAGSRQARENILEALHAACPRR